MPILNDDPPVDTMAISREDLPAATCVLCDQAKENKQEEPQQEEVDLRMMKRMERRSVHSDLEGLSRLSVDAFRLTTGVVEAQHSRLDWFSNIVFPDRGTDKVRNPIAAAVYGSIHAINGVVGAALGLSLNLLKPVLGDSTPSYGRDGLIAVLNGVVGDYLEKENNPLAISMQWRTQDGWLLDTDEKLQEIWKESNERILLMIHGSCNMIHGWWQEQHNHGIALAQAWGYTPLFLQYNTGLHISENGKRLAASLDRLAGSYKQTQPEKPLSLAVVAHSMGGLVSRSACHYAETNPEECNSNQWLGRLGHLMTLGAPHHGAVMERQGKLVDELLGAHHFTEPISWLGKIRSNGVTDLGYGNVRDEDWEGYSGKEDYRIPTPLPKMVRCLAIAAVSGDMDSSSNPLSGSDEKWDGWVSQASALGIDQSNTDLNLKFDQVATVFGEDHMGLLRSDEVYDIMHSFLDPTCHPQ